MNDDRLMAFVRTGIEELALIRDVYARFLGNSPITKRLADVRAVFFGGTSSITIEPDRVRAANIQLQPLIQAEKGYFAERDYNSTDQNKLQADAKKAARRTVDDWRFDRKRGQRRRTRSDEFIAHGGSQQFDIYSGQCVTQDQQALDFISGCANWLLSREQLIGIAPKVPKTLTFNLNEDALRSLRWIILVLIPFVFVVIGGAVWWQRRA